MLYMKSTLINYLGDFQFISALRLALSVISSAPSALLELGDEGFGARGQGFGARGQGSWSYEARVLELGDKGSGAREQGLWS